MLLEVVVEETGVKLAWTCCKIREYYKWSGEGRWLYFAFYNISYHIMLSQCSVFPISYILCYILKVV